MRIEMQSREFDKKEMFKMANDNHLLMKNLSDGSVINVTDYVRYTTDASEVINGIFISVSVVVESSCLAFSAASFNL